MAKYVTEDNLTRYTAALKLNATVLDRNKPYVVGDIVQKGQVYLKCITAGTTATTALTLSSVINTVLTDGTVEWQVIDPFAETKIRDWESGVKYEVSRIVKHNGSLYRCITANNDATFTISNWELLVTGITDWTSGNNYVVGQFVVYNGALYECTTANNDATFDPINWQKIAGGGLDTWTANTSYSVGDIVINANKIYQCNTAHTSGSTFITDASNWTEISACITRIPNWEVSTDYVVGDLVSHDAKIYRCTTAHTSDATQWDSAEEANWEELSPTINEITTWVVSTDYAIGQLVIHNNKLYRCNTAHTSDSSSFNTDIAYWDEIGSSGGIESWKANELYQQGNTVVYNDKIYICDTAHTSTSTFDPTKWHEISSNDIDNWQTSTSYNVGDMVVKDGQLYRCITQHTSDSSDFNNDIANWQTLDTKWKAVNWTASTLYIVGEVVLYNNTPVKCTTTHVSDTTYELDKNNWETLSANIREWVSGNTYKVGDTVIYKYKLYRCNTDTNDTAFVKSEWDEISDCNIEVWRSAPNPNILGLFHFNDSNNIFYNEIENSNFQFNIQSGNFGALGDGKFDSGLAVTRLDTSTSQLDFSTGSEVYTVEWWNYIAGPTPAGAYARNWSLEPEFSFGYGNSNIYVGSTSIGSFSYNTWFHVAIVINANELTIYIDGVSLGTFTRTSPNTSVYLYTIGNYFGSSHNVIDELRVSNIAQYSSNFSVPTSPYTDPNYVGYSYNDFVVYEDKLYRCIVSNNDATFIPTHWSEVSPCVGGGIEEWSSGSDYTSGDVILYNNNLYKVVNDITGAIDTPDNSNDYVLLGGDSIKTWVGSREYSAGTIVLHQNRLYRNANDISSSVTTFSRDDWTPLSPVLEDWTSSKEYKVGDFVIRNDILYECTIDNNDVIFNSAKWKPISKEGINAWQSSTQYALYDLVVEDEDLYMCISPHTSSSDFQTDLDAERWKLIGGGGGSGGDWNQVTKMNVVAPLDVDINIPYTNTFKRPPVEVLKYEQGTTDITTNVLNFGVGDGSKFEIDGVTASESPLITFDGVAKPNHDILYPFGTPTQMVDKYYSESEEIDLDDFKVVGEVSLE